MSQARAVSNLSEGQTGSVEYWISTLSATVDDIKNLQSQLILRKMPGVATQLRLDFVGLISLRNNAFFVLPKIYGHTYLDNPISAIKATFSCIQKYQTSTTRVFKSAEAGEANVFSEAGTVVDTFISIVAWTEEHGFHHSDEILRYDEYSHINWRETILRNFPIHFGNSVFYGEPLGYRTLPKRSLIAEFQARALVSLSKSLGALSEIWLPTYNPIMETANEIIQDSLLYADDKEIRGMIEDSLFAANRDHDREILDILSMWINLDHRASNETLLYGTNAFHVVWEDMCVSLFTDRNLSNHTSLASQPAYSSSDITIRIGPQRPDILFEFSGSVWIADAKWYDFDKGDVPQLSDIVKQVFYEMTVMSELETQGNLFLVPGLGGSPWARLGQMEMMNGNDKDARFPVIEVIRLNWEDMAYSYSTNKIPNWRDELINERAQTLQK